MRVRTKATAKPKVTQESRTNGYEQQRIAQIAAQLFDCNENSSDSIGARHVNKASQSRLGLRYFCLRYALSGGSTH